MCVRSCIDPTKSEVLSWPARSAVCDGSTLLGSPAGAQLDVQSLTSGGGMAEYLDVFCEVRAWVGQVSPGAPFPRPKPPLLVLSGHAGSLTPY